MAVEIFLSYVREDKKIVDDLYRELKMARLNPWMDYPPPPFQHSGLRPGDDWDQAITTKINEVELVLACFSRASVEKHSDYQQREIRLALDRMNQVPPGKILVVPVLLEECKPREIRVGALSLSSMQWYRYYRDGLDGLVGFVNDHAQASTSPLEKEHLLDPTQEPSLASPLQTEEEAFVLLRRIRTLDEAFVEAVADYLEEARRLSSEMKQHVLKIQQLGKSPVNPYVVKRRLNAAMNASAPTITRQKENDRRARSAITQILDATEAAYQEFFAAYSDHPWVDADLLEVQRPRLEKMRTELEKLTEMNRGLLNAMLALQSSTERVNKAKRLRIQELREFDAALANWNSAIDRSESYLDEAQELVK